MEAIGRRRFCALVAGLSAAWVVGCSSSDGAASVASSDPAGPLAGVSLDVRRDPG